MQTTNIDKVSQSATVVDTEALFATNHRGSPLTVLLLSTHPVSLTR